MLKIINKEGKEFAHYMIKEIFDQPQAARNLIEKFIDRDKHKTKLAVFNKKVKKIKKFDQVVIIACGTSYHAALAGQNLFSELAGLPASAVLAHEFYGRKYRLDKKTFIIAISQSGETADTVKAAKLVKKQGGFLISITNDVGSKLGKLGDISFPLLAGEEKSVTATKTFTAQVILLSFLAVYLGRANGLPRTTSKRIIKELESMPEKMDKTLHQSLNIQIIANKYYKMKNLFVLGRNDLFPVALETALKFKEATYIHAEGQAAGELKHGILAAIDKFSPVLYFAPTDSAYPSNILLIKELKKLKKKIIVLTTQGNRQLISLADTVIYVPKTFDPLAPLLYIIFIQLLTYHIAVLRGINPDKPRNLTKFVM